MLVKVYMIKITKFVYRSKLIWLALMEIVSEPDLNSPQEAAQYVKKLRAILSVLGVVMVIWKEVT